MVLSTLIQAVWSLPLVSVGAVNFHVCEHVVLIFVVLAPAQNDVRVLVAGQRREPSGDPGCSFIHFLDLASLQVWVTREFGPFTLLESKYLIFDLHCESALHIEAASSDSYQIFRCTRWCTIISFFLPIVRNEARGEFPALVPTEVDRIASVEFLAFSVHGHACYYVFVLRITTINSHNIFGYFIYYT